MCSMRLRDQNSEPNPDPSETKDAPRHGLRIDVASPTCRSEFDGAPRNQDADARSNSHPGCPDAANETAAIRGPAGT